MAMPTKEGLKSAEKLKGSLPDSMEMFLGVQSGASAPNSGWLG